MNYKLIDSGQGRRLEKYGPHLLDRPDPQVIWQKTLSESEWKKADAFFGNRWETRNVPENWQMEHNGIKFWAGLAPFKHTGVFPEQSIQWEQISNSIIQSDNNSVNFLNLFGYTGIASLFASKAGAKVTHLDASKPSITWANENAKLNNIENIRWIIDDALKFTEREIKRGVKYDAIMMDPPVYGHGPKGEVWDFNKHFPELLNNCKQILSDNPIFVLVNAYAISSSSITLANTLNDYFGKLGGQIENGELVLKEESAGRMLSTGIWARWSK
jgi:23S rRNA (cytosine1962-C5)-methyltransferase